MVFHTWFLFLYIVSHVFNLVLFHDLVNGFDSNSQKNPSVISVAHHEFYLTSTSPAHPVFSLIKQKESHHIHNYHTYSSMSSRIFTVGDMKYIEGSTLKTWILQGHTNLGSKFQVIDVRDADYVGGHIINCKHIESRKFKDGNSLLTLSLLLNNLREKNQQVVVFHCMLSQQRGPSSAMRFMRYLNEKLELSNDEAEVKFIENMKIFILRGGFGKWQESYGDDPNLTEGYEKEIWKFGY